MENKIKSIIKKLSKLGFSVKPKDGGRTDPVCGMEASGDLFESKYKGRSYYFCSDHCRAQFVASPPDFAD